MNYRAPLSAKLSFAVLSVAVSKMAAQFELRFGGCRALPVTSLNSSALISNAFRFFPFERRAPAELHFLAGARPRLRISCLAHVSEQWRHYQLI